MIEKTKDPKRVATGKRNRQSGAIWERKVRHDLEDNSWIVTKWQNNVETKSKAGLAISSDDYKLIPAKRKYNPFNKALAIGTGFPDFMAYKFVDNIGSVHTVLDGFLKKDLYQVPVYEVLGVEAKSNGILTRQEKEKCSWLLRKQIFNKILIASKNKVGRKIIVEYTDFSEKYKKYL